MSVTEGNKEMKLLAALFAFASLALFAPNSYADPVLTVTAGAGNGVLVETPIVGGVQWTYLDNQTKLFNLLPPVATIDDNLFTATFTDIAGVSLLNVTDVCANAGIFHAANPCSLQFAFSDTDLGVPYLLSNVNLLGLLSANVNADALNIEVGGASVGGGNATFGFGQPPAATPEPGSLALLGTGVLGLAGVVRRRFSIA